MTRASRPAFRELRHVFTAYLHEDFVQEWGTAEDAVRAFFADASAVERQRFQREARQFLADIEGRDFNDVRQELRELGCRWHPPSRAALVALLSI